MLQGFTVRQNQTLLTRHGLHMWESIAFKRFTGKRKQVIKPARNLLDKACIYIVRPVTPESQAALFKAFAEIEALLNNKRQGDNHHD